MQRSNPKYPQYFSIIGMTYQDATVAANLQTKKYKVYCTAVPNPDKVRNKKPTFVVSNCYHPWQVSKEV